MSRILVILGVLIVLDIYAFQAVRTISFARSLSRRIAYFSYALLAAVSYLFVLLLSSYIIEPEERLLKAIISGFLLATYIGKFMATIVLFLEDVYRFTRWIGRKLRSGYNFLFRRHTAPISKAEPLSRSEFLAKSSLALTAFPLISTTYGMVVGAHDYRIRKETLKLPNLPIEFDGIRITQISDIHSGSFFNKTAVIRGLEMIQGTKADIVVFTGDLVNNRAREIGDYFEVFNKIKAPLGVYSSLGNHDYGYRFNSDKDREQNFKEMIELHERLGWDLLRNENRLLKVDNEVLSIVGVENWSANPRFPRLGDLRKALEGSQDAPVHVLLSHDPSHWDAQVRKEFKKTDLMLAGHTHGMQMGVEIGDIRWSPSQYGYKQWAGLYEENGQYLYVNRGFGYIGLPARIGMPPEITVIELKQA